MHRKSCFWGMLPAFVLALSIGGAQASDVSVNVAADSAFVVNVPASTTRLRIDNGSAIFQGSVYADNGSTLLGAGANYDNTTSKGFFSNSTNTASGSYSTAFGQGSTASRSYAFAGGFNTTASGEGSAAFGRNTTARGNGSAAFGSSSSATYDGAIAFGQSTASNYYAIAGGLSTTASGYASTAFG